jgi:transposase
LAGDKAYSSRSIRRWLRRHHVRAVIPERSDQILHRHGRPAQFDVILYRRRNAVERLVGWLKERRRLATRYEKLAQTFRGMLSVAFMERYFNALDAFRDAA